MQMERIMTREVITIGPEAGLTEAAQKMKTHDIRHLPVIADGRVVGLVTDRDIRGALFPSVLADLTVGDVMVRDPLTVSPESRLEDVVRLAYLRKLGCLPVVDAGGGLAGIVTVVDMLGALVELLGFLGRSSRLDLELPDAPDALEAACRIIHRHGGVIINISLTQAPGRPPIHLFRIENADIDRIRPDLAAAGITVLSALR